MAVSAKGSRVFKWSASGNLVWEAVLSPAPIFPPVSSQLPGTTRRMGGGSWSDGVDAALVLGGKTPALLILANNGVHKLNMKTGESMWSEPDVGDGTSTTTSFGAVTEVGGNVLAIGTDGDNIVVATRNANTGAAVGKMRSIEVVPDGGSSGLVGCRLVNGGRHVVCIGSEQLFVAPLLHMKWHCAHKRDIHLALTSFVGVACSSPHSLPSTAIMTVCCLMEIHSAMHASIRNLLIEWSISSEFVLKPFNSRCICHGQVCF